MSFLRNYMLMTSGSEVPENYHFWSGVFALSCVVNRQVWLDMGQYVLYPNIYVVLLGPPGNGKSLAMDTAQNIIEDVGGINFSGDAQTKESLVRVMRDKCVKQFECNGESGPITVLSMFATELSHLLGPNSGHMIDFLTTIYTKDKRYASLTKNKGDDILERPFLNLIACTTQQWITTYLKSDIIGGGFTRRVIFVNEPVASSVEDKSLRKPFLVVTPEQRTAKENVLAYANVLKGVRGGFTWDPEAKHAYEHWYLTRDIPNDPDTQGYYKTKPNQVLKVAMLIALSRTPATVLTKTDFEVALALFDKTEATLLRVFQGIGRNELNAVANKVVEMLYAAPERDFKDAVTGKTGKSRFIPEKQLRGMLYKDAPGRELDDVMNHLTSTDKIFKFGITTNNITRVFIGLRE